MHISHGSSSKLVGSGGHFGYLGSSHYPTSRRGCFEYGDMGHFLKDILRTKNGADIRVLRLLILGLHNLHLGEVYRVVELVLI